MPIAGGRPAAGQYLHPARWSAQQAVASATCLAAAMTKAPIATFFRAAQDNRGVSYTGDWSTLAARLARIDRGTKEGPAFTCGNFGGNTRSRAHLVSRALVALDIEASKTTGEVPPPLPEAMERVRRKRLACAGYKSFSSTPELPRYRLVFPLDTPVDLAEHAALDRELARQAAIELGLAGVTDESKLGAESLFYFGRTAVRPEDRQSFVLEGEPINGADLVARAATATCGQAMEESERAALKRASVLDPAVAEIIGAFNEAHPLTQMLTRYGYIRQGGRWKSRHQGAGSIGATCVVPDGVVGLASVSPTAKPKSGARPIANRRPPAGATPSTCSCTTSMAAISAPRWCRSRPAWRAAPPCRC